jgi:hypothetical protein
MKEEIKEFYSITLKLLLQPLCGEKENVTPQQRALVALQSLEGQWLLLSSKHRVVC